MKRWLWWIYSAVIIQVLVIVLVTRDADAPTSSRDAARRWEPIAPVPVVDLPPLVDRVGAPVLRPERPAIVYFWATWCDPCVRHMADTLALTGRADVDVWLVARDESWASVERHFAGAVPRAVVHDAGLGDALGVSVLPTSFRVDARGRVVARVIGTLGAEHLAP